MTDLLLRAQAAAQAWRPNDYEVVGRRIGSSGASCCPMLRRPRGHGCGRWITSSIEDRTPTHGYEATREAAMAAFAKSWRRE